MKLFLANFASYTSTIFIIEIPGAQFNFVLFRNIIKTSIFNKTFFSPPRRSRFVVGSSLHYGSYSGFLFSLCLYPYLAHSFEVKLKIQSLHFHYVVMCCEMGIYTTPRHGPSFIGVLTNATCTSILSN